MRGLPKALELELEFELLSQKFLFSMPFLLLSSDSFWASVSLSVKWTHTR
jgi:hypothetical protein